jgi:hypothetical protein
MLDPHDFKKINKESIIYIFRSDYSNIKDDCCGFWCFKSINNKNEIIISHVNKINKTTQYNDLWSVEWLDKGKGIYGWFPYSDNDYPLKYVEYKIILIHNKNLNELIKNAKLLHSLKN